MLRQFNPQQGIQTNHITPVMANSYPVVRRPNHTGSMVPARSLQSHLKHQEPQLFQGHRSRADFCDCPAKIIRWLTSQTHACRSSNCSNNQTGGARFTAASSTGKKAIVQKAVYKYCWLSGQEVQSCDLKRRSLKASTACGCTAEPRPALHHRCPEDIPPSEDDGWKGAIADSTVVQRPCQARREGLKTIAPQVQDSMWNTRLFCDEFDPPVQATRQKCRAETIEPEATHHWTEPCAAC